MSLISQDQYTGGLSFNTPAMGDTTGQSGGFHFDLPLATVAAFNQQALNFTSDASKARLGFFSGVQQQTQAEVSASRSAAQSTIGANVAAMSAFSGGFRNFFANLFASRPAPAPMVSFVAPTPAPAPVSFQAPAPVAPAPAPIVAPQPAIQHSYTNIGGYGIMDTGGMTLEQVQYQQNWWANHPIDAGGSGGA